MRYAEYKFLKKIHKHKKLKHRNCKGKEFTHVRELKNKGYIEITDDEILFLPLGRKEFNEYAWKLRQERLKYFFTIFIGVLGIIVTVIIGLLPFIV